MFHSVWENGSRLAEVNRVCTKRDYNCFFLSVECLSIHNFQIIKTREPFDRHHRFDRIAESWSCSLKIIIIFLMMIWTDETTFTRRWRLLRTHKTWKIEFVTCFGRFQIRWLHQHNNGTCLQNDEEKFFLFFVIFQTIKMLNRFKCCAPFSESIVMWLHDRYRVIIYVSTYTRSNRIQFWPRKKRRPIFRAPYISKTPSMNYSLEL